jgi:hypothetical protein
MLASNFPDHNFLTDGVTSVTRYAGHVDMFKIGQNGALMWAWSDAHVDQGGFAHPDGHGGTTTWSQIGDPDFVYGSPVTVVARRPDHLDVFAVGLDGTLDVVYRDDQTDNGSWSHPDASGHPSTLFPIGGPGLFVPGSSVSALARKPEHLDLFAVGTNGAVETAWWDSNPTGVLGVRNPDWAGWGHSSTGIVGPVVWSQVGPANTFPAGTFVASLSRSPSHIDLFAVNDNGALQTAWWDQNTDGGSWVHSTVGSMGFTTQFNPPYTLTSIGPTQTFLPGSPVTAVSNQSSHMEVFAVGVDGSIKTAWSDAAFDGGGWNHPGSGALTTIGGTNLFLPGTRIAAESPTAAGVELLALSTDGDLMAAARNGGTSTHWVGPVDGSLLAYYSGVADGSVGVTQRPSLLGDILGFLGDAVVSAAEYFVKGEAGVALDIATAVSVGTDVLHGDGTQFLNDALHLGGLGLGGPGLGNLPPGLAVDYGNLLSGTFNGLSLLLRGHLEDASSALFSTWVGDTVGTTLGQYGQGLWRLLNLGGDHRALSAHDRDVLGAWYPDLELSRITVTYGANIISTSFDLDGQTIGDDIYIPKAYNAFSSDAARLTLLAHELTHVRQFEEPDQDHGDLGQYGGQFFRGLLSEGTSETDYEHYPMEVEAYRTEDIFNQWINLGGMSGPLGKPLTAKDQTSADGKTVFRNFQGGTISMDAGNLTPDHRALVTLPNGSPVRTTVQVYVLDAAGTLSLFNRTTAAGQTLDANVQSFTVNPVYGDMLILHRDGTLWVRPTSGSMYQANSGVTQVAIGSDGVEYVLGTDGRLSTWNPGTGAVVDSNVRSFAINPKYGDVVMLHRDGTLFVRPRGGSTYQANSGVTQFAAGPDGLEFVLRNDGTLSTWNIDTSVSAVLDTNVAGITLDSTGHRLGVLHRDNGLSALQIAVDLRTDGTEYVLRPDGGLWAYNPKTPAGALVDSNVETFRVNPVYGDVVMLHCDGTLWVRPTSGSTYQANSGVAQFDIGSDGVEYVLLTDGGLATWNPGTGVGTALDTNVQSFAINPVYGDVLMLERNRALSVRALYGSTSLINVGVTQFDIGPDGVEYVLRADGGLATWNPGTGVGTALDTNVQSFAINRVYGDVLVLERNGMVFDRPPGGSLSQVNGGMAQVAVAPNGLEYMLDDSGTLWIDNLASHSLAVVASSVGSFVINPVYGDVVMLHRDGTLWVRPTSGSTYQANSGVAQFDIGSDGVEYVLRTDGGLATWNPGTSAGAVVDSNVRSFAINPVYGDVVMLHRDGTLFVRPRGGSTYQANSGVTQFAAGPDGLEYVLRNDGTLSTWNPGTSAGGVVASNVQSFAINPVYGDVAMLHRDGTLWVQPTAGRTYQANSGVAQIAVGTNGVEYVLRTDGSLASWNQSSASSQVLDSYVQSFTVAPTGPVVVVLTDGTVWKLTSSGPVRLS